MLRLSKFERNDCIFNQVSEQTKLTKWGNIDLESHCSNSEELLAIFDNDTLIGYIHIEDVTEKWAPESPEFGITKFFIFPAYQKKGYGKKAALALFEKKKTEGYTNIIMQVEQGIRPFWDNVIASQEFFLKENINLIDI